MQRFSLPITFGLLLGFCVGCQPTADQASTAKGPAAPAANSHAGHNHGQDATGVHGGHLLHLEPTGVHAEWTHDDDSHLVTVYLDDFEQGSIKEVKFVAKIGDQTEEFPLQSGEGGSWSISSEALMTHMNMGEAAVVTFEVTDASGKQSTKIEGHEEHGHSH